jgi:hypothetical protein
MHGPDRIPNDSHDRHPRHSMVRMAVAMSQTMSLLVSDALPTQRLYRMRGSPPVEPVSVLGFGAEFVASGPRLWTGLCPVGCKAVVLDEVAHLDRQSQPPPPESDATRLSRATWSCLRRSSSWRWASSRLVRWSRIRSSNKSVLRQGRTPVRASAARTNALACWQDTVSPGWGVTDNHSRP